MVHGSIVDPATTSADFTDVELRQNHEFVTGFELLNGRSMWFPRDARGCLAEIR